MTSSTKASIANSVTALLSITTPFVQPTDCETQWRTASASSRTFRGTALMTLLMVSDPAASCYPSGWDDFASNDRLRFMPGVCPHGWTYNQMGENGSREATTAFCCDRLVVHCLSVDCVLRNPLTSYLVASPTSLCLTQVRSIAADVGAGILGLEATFRIQQHPRTK